MNKMTNINSIEKRDEQVVASKLPRIEFANFKKLCDLEEKTPSKKIRDLINKEVNEKFGGLYKSIYDKEKIRQFQTNTIWDYNNSLVVEKICKVNFVNRTDEKFIQIGLRPVIEEDIFLPGGDVFPKLPSLGMQIAIGERDFLVNSILGNKEIKKVKIDKTEIEKFPNEIDFNKSSILISNDFFVNIAQLLMKRIEYKDHKMLLDSSHSLFFVPGEVMRNKIIIIEKDSILWTKQKFQNQFTNKEESLDISIEPMIGGKVDIVARSVNRIKSLYPEEIKILEIEE